VLVTVNTDDPAMFGNSLAEEYARLHAELGFTPEEIRQLILNAVDACWLPAERKAELAAELRQDPAWPLPG
jgi:adenosine deaminase